VCAADLEYKVSGIEKCESYWHLKYVTTTAFLSFLLILVRAVDSGSLNFASCRGSWRERYSKSLNGHGSNAQPSDWEAGTLPLRYCRPLSKTTV